MCDRVFSRFRALVLILELISKLKIQLVDKTSLERSDFCAIDPESRDARLSKRLAHHVRKFGPSQPFHFEKAYCQGSHSCDWTVRHEYLFRIMRGISKRCWQDSDWLYVASSTQIMGKLRKNAGSQKEYIAFRCIYDPLWSYNHHNLLDNPLSPKFKQRPSYHKSRRFIPISKAKWSS